MSAAKSVLKLLTSRFLAQVLAILIAPVLTRLYAPEEFGIRQVFMSIFTILSVMVCLRYEFSIPLSRDKNEAIHSVLLTLFLTTVFSLLAIILVFLLRSRIATWYQMPELAMFLWLLPMFIFIKGFSLTIRYWAAYHRYFTSLACANFASALFNRPVALLWAVLFVPATVTGLFLGSFGQLSGAFLVLVLFCGGALINEIKSSDVSIAGVKSVAVRHKKFPIFSTWAAFLNTFSQQLPVFMLGLFFGKEQIGYYFLARNMVGMPMSLVSQSVSQVFFPTAAKAYNERGDMSSIVMETFKRLVQIAALPMVMLAFLSGRLFPFVFGEQWNEAGIYVQILAPWLFFRFISSSWSTIFSILNRQGTGLIYLILSFIFPAISLYIGGQYSFRTALVLFSISNIIFIVCPTVLRLKLSGVSVFWAAWKVIKYIVVCSILVAPVYFLSPFIGPLGTLLFAVFVGGIYVVVLLVYDISLRRFVLSLFRGKSLPDEVSQ
ncbi:MAG: oligosaccharide flippase family protein [Planctomycetota bacterium]|jgi:O-antigen/teichoic acid export membrane protein